MDAIKYSTIYFDDGFIPVEPVDYYDPIFQLFLAVALGLLFGPFSLGLFFFIVIYLIMEIWYAYLRGFKYTPMEMLVRFLIFLIGLLAFLAAKYLSGDFDPVRFHYDE